jgi:hypothetical protein
VKGIFTILLLITSLSTFSQSDLISGEYFREFGDEEHLVKRKLNLNQDGTFTFHNYSNIKAGIPQVVNRYGKGTWSTDGKVVSFFTDNEKDIDEKHTLDFSGSRARFITKPSRDKTDRIIETRLQFFESKIFWIKRLKIFKI